MVGAGARQRPLGFPARGDGLAASAGGRRFQNLLQDLLKPVPRAGTRGHESVEPQASDDDDQDSRYGHSSSPGRVSRSTFDRLQSHRMWRGTAPRIRILWQRKGARKGARHLKELGYLCASRQRFERSRANVTTPARKFLPDPTPETAPYWEGAKAHELRIQFCTECQKHFFYPRIFCPTCLSDAVEWRNLPA